VGLRQIKGTTVAVASDPFAPQSDGNSLQGISSAPLEDGGTEAQQQAALEAVGLTPEVILRLLAAGKDDAGRVEDWHLCLSAGELQRVAIARLILRQPVPHLVLLDEALGAQDEDGLMACMKALRNVGCAVVLVTH